MKRVLVIRPNHRLGNLLLITPLVQEVTRVFPEATIDLFTKGGLAPIVFKNYDSIGKIIELPKKPFRALRHYFGGWKKILQTEYDIVINAVDNSSSGKLAARLVSAPIKLAGELDDEGKRRYPRFRHIALQPLYSFRHHLSKLGFPVDESETPDLSMKLSHEEVSQGRNVLEQLTGNQSRTILLYTFATGDKLHPPTWWIPFYELLKKTLPDHNIVEILPVENVSQLAFKATSFYSRDIREIAAVIANAEMFIGTDSGIMHLASASGTPTVGLFSVTEMESYRPYNEGSIGVNTRQTSIEELVRQVHLRLTSGTQDSKS